MNAEFAQALEEVDWRSYQDNVMAALKEALEKYRTLYAGGGVNLISQIALWTAPYQHITAVSFETHVHAQKMIDLDTNYVRGSDPEVDALDGRFLNAFQGNPADFEYQMFHTFQHLELAALSEFDLNEPELDTALLLKIEANLLVVVEQIQQSQMLRDEPTEDEVWIGVNSPLDWYDDVIKMTVRTR